MNAISQMTPMNLAADFIVVDDSLRNTRTLKKKNYILFYLPDKYPEKDRIPESVLEFDILIMIESVPA